VISSLGKDAPKNRETYNQVPTILGTNKEEYKLFLIGLYGTMPDDAYQALALSISEQWQQAGVNDLAAAMTANKGQPGVYAYEFDYGAYNKGGYNAWPYFFGVMICACHTMELPFIFGKAREQSLSDPSKTRDRNKKSHQAQIDPIFVPGTVLTSLSASSQNWRSWNKRMRRWISRLLDRSDFEARGKESGKLAA